MSMEFRYHTLKNIGIGLAIGIILCLVTLAMEAVFNTQDVVILF